MAEPYELTKDAEVDLREVARYTLKKWGKEKLNTYRGGLKKIFRNISQKEITGNSFSEVAPFL